MFRASARLPDGGGSYGRSRGARRAIEAGPGMLKVRRHPALRCRVCAPRARATALRAKHPSTSAATSAACAPFGGGEKSASGGARGARALRARDAARATELTTVRLRGGGALRRTDYGAECEAGRAVTELMTVPGARRRSAELNAVRGAMALRATAAVDRGHTSSRAAGLRERAATTSRRCGGRLWSARSRGRPARGAESGSALPDGHALSEPTTQRRRHAAPHKSSD